MSDDSRSVPIGPVLPHSQAALRTMYFIAFLDLLGFGIIIPLLAFYVPSMQQHPLKVTLLFAVYSICQFIGAPILGLMSDRFGRAIVLALSQAGSSAGYLLLAAAGYHWHSPGTILLLLYISRIIDGFTGGNISTAQAFISDNTTQSERAKAMGMLGASFGLGFVLGPWIGGVLGGINLMLPGFFAAALSASAAVLSMVTLPDNRTHKPTEAETWLHPGRFVPILRNPVTAELMAISFFLMCAYVSMESTMALYLNELRGWKQTQVGWFFAYVGVIIVIVQARFIGRWVKRHGEWALAALGPMLVTIGTLLYVRMAWQNALAVLFLGGAFNSVGRCIQMPTMTSLLSKFTRRSEQGATFGLFHGLSSLARAVGPVAAGLCYTHLRHTGQFVLAACIALCVSIWTFSLRQPAPTESPPPSAAPAAEAAIEIAK